MRAQSAGAVEAPLAGTPRTPARARMARPRSAWRALAALIALACGAGVALLAHGSLGPAHPAARAHPQLQRLAATPAAALSAALAHHDPRYRIAAADGGFSAANPAQSLHVRFAGTRTMLGTGALEVSLELHAAGYAGALSRVAPARALAARNTLTRTHGALREWYRNSPLGLEQGFTLARALPHAGSGALTLEIALAGNAHAALARDGRSISLAGAGRTLRYGSLWALDARGRSLPARLRLRGGHVLLVVDTRGARYPVTIDPLVAQELSVSGESPPNRLGRAVAISADGSTALVGAPLEGGVAGGAFVFVRSGETWEEQASLKAPQFASTAFFGASVALSADGNTALVGDPTGSSGAGDVLVFTRSEGRWSEFPQKLTPSDESGRGEFGRSVSLSADGSTALIGAPFDETRAGAAWIFTRSGNSFSQLGSKLTGAGESGKAWFGRSVALSADGSTALIGGPLDNHYAGAAWVYTRSGGEYVPQAAKLEASGESGPGRFGWAVALSRDGSRALVGAPRNAEETGAAWAFTRSAEGYGTGSELTGAGALARFGASVALSADASTALIGAPGEGAGTGSAWMYINTGASWSQNGSTLTPGGEPGEAQFGFSVALSENGTAGLVGAPFANGGAGAAWVFTPETVTPEEPPTTSTTTTTTTTTTTSNTTNTQTNTTARTSTGGVDVFHAANNVPAPPVLGVSGNLALETGTVLVLLPGSHTFVTLSGTMHVPFGTVIDATHGVVTVTVMGPHGETEVAHYFDGEFVLSQTRNGTVLATLSGGNFAGCKRAHGKAKKGHKASAARSRRPIRKLWTNAHGSFSTKGSYAAGAVQGTEWVTEDFCEGTLIRVTRDKVKVTNLVKHRTKLVTAGHSLFVKSH